MVRRFRDGSKTREFRGSFKCGQGGREGGAAQPAGSMASKGLGKVRGLTRPGSKLPAAVGSAAAAPAPAAVAAAAIAAPVRGSALVGRSVRRAASGKSNDDERGEVTHFSASSDTYRVGCLARRARPRLPSARHGCLCSPGRGAKLTRREGGQVKYGNGEMCRMSFDELQLILLESSSAGKPGTQNGAAAASPAEAVSARECVCACTRLRPVPLCSGPDSTQTAVVLR